VKLLFDENLSPKFVQAFVSEYPGSTHVRTLGLRGATDAVIWERAQQGDRVGPDRAPAQADV
jgi:predicted nuclease of predicted toxin-antitoxin system